MGESFLGIPNRFRNIDNLLEKTYNPNHMLSAHMGYELSKEFDNYVSRSGGTNYAMTGTFVSLSIEPATDDTYNIGSSTKKYKNMYADKFIGNADTASALDHYVKLSVNGDMIGDVKFTGKESVVSLSLKTNHHHDSSYLKLSGGAMTGSITLNGTDIGLANKSGYPVFTVNSNSTNIGQGPYTRSTGSMSLYSHNALNIYARTTMNLNFMNSNNSNVRSLIFNSGDSYCGILNTRSGNWLCLNDNGTLTYGGQTIYHTGNFPSSNFIPASASCNKNWNWSGQGGQPTWVWGGNDGINMYVYNPLNWKVNTANKADLATAARRLDSADSSLGKGEITKSDNVYNQFSVGLTNQGNFRPYWCWEWSDTNHYNGAQYDADNCIGLGTTKYRWKQVCAAKSTIVTSDRNMKDNIMKLTDKYTEFLMLLEPSSFTFRYPGSDRTHVGFIAQQVEEAMEKVGLSDLDFAGFCKDIKVSVTIDADGNEIEEPVLDENGGCVYIYSLRYEEFIAINTYVIQKCFREIQDLKSYMTKEINSLKNLVAQKM